MCALHYRKRVVTRNEAISFRSLTAPVYKLYYKSCNQLPCGTMRFSLLEKVLSLCYVALYLCSRLDGIKKKRDKEETGWNRIFTYARRWPLSSRERVISQRSQKSAISLYLWLLFPYYRGISCDIIREVDYASTFIRVYIYILTPRSSVARYNNRAGRREEEAR